MISFCCPSRGRPKLAKHLIRTASETQKGDTEFLFYLNDDDHKLEEYRDTIDEKHYTVGPNQSTCLSWNLMAQRAKHDIVMLMGGDKKELKDKVRQAVDALEGSSSGGS